MSSGKPANSKVSEHLLKYTEIGEVAAETFLKNRVISDKTKFHDTLNKQNLQTFQSMVSKKTLSSSQKKAVQVKAERNLLGRL